VFQSRTVRLLFPQRTLNGRVVKIGFTLEILADLKRAEPEVFAAQYLNAPTSSKDQLFPETLLQSITKSSHDADYPKEAPCIFTIDLATGKRADADHSVVAVGRSGHSRARVDCRLYRRHTHARTPWQ
jgi:hypothetical protein